MKYLFMSFAPHFVFCLFVFLWIKEILSIFWTPVLWLIYMYWEYFLSVCRRLFHITVFFKAFFKKQNSKFRWNATIKLCSYNDLCSVCPTYQSGFKYTFPWFFFFRSFRVPSFKFSLLIHLELIFANDIK